MRGRNKNIRNIEKREIVRRMKESGKLSVQDIALFCGLSEEQVRAL